MIIYVSIYLPNLSIHRSTQFSTYLSQSSYCYSGQLPSWEWRWCRPLQGLPSQVAHVAPKILHIPRCLSEGIPFIHRSPSTPSESPGFHQQRRHETHQVGWAVSGKHRNPTRSLTLSCTRLAKRQSTGFLLGSSSCCCHTFIMTYVFLY